MSDSYDNIYCYPGTNILKNKLGIRDEKKLENAEKKITMLKLYDIINETKNSKKPYDIYTSKYFRRIHKKMFEDIYDFAGEYRNVDISKGSFRFAEAQYISKMMEVIFDEISIDFTSLENEKLDKSKLSFLIAKHMANLNVLHPFREGNGRTTREYFRQIAYYFGYILDFNIFSDKDILEAMKFSVIDEKKLQKIIFSSLKKNENK